MELVWDGQARRMTVFIIVRHRIGFSNKDLAQSVYLLKYLHSVIYIKMLTYVINCKHRDKYDAYKADV